MRVLFSNSIDKFPAHTAIAIYGSTANIPRQLTFEVFHLSCGIKLSVADEWYVLAERINWKTAETIYAGNFKSRKGYPTVSVRQALGALIIQKRTRLNDRALVKAIAENPYYQYFIGLPAFSTECSFTYSTIALFRKRITVEILTAESQNAPAWNPEISPRQQNAPCLCQCPHINKKMSINQQALCKKAVNYGSKVGEKKKY